MASEIRRELPETVVLVWVGATLKELLDLLERLPRCGALTLIWAGNEIEKAGGWVLWAPPGYPPWSSQG